MKCKTSLPENASSLMIHKNYHAQTNIVKQSTKKIDNNREEESEDILGEPAAPISTSTKKNKGCGYISGLWTMNQCSQVQKNYLTSRNHMVDVSSWNGTKSIPG